VSERQIGTRVKVDQINGGDHSSVTMMTDKQKRGEAAQNGIGMRKLE
jgi:hypothetical protein